MKKLSLYLLASIGFLVVAATILASVAYFSSTEVRRLAVRGVSELPTAATFMLVRRHLVRRNFEGVASILSRQLDWHKEYALEQSILLPSLIQNTEYAVENTRLDSEWQALRTYLEALNDATPGLYRPKIWYGRALLSDAPEQAFTLAEQASRMVPALADAYKLGVEAAIRLNDQGRVKELCAAYQTAHLGGPRSDNNNTLAVGVGLRKLLLEVGSSSGETFLIENQGVTLGERETYKFSLPRDVMPGLLRLHMANVPGVAYTIHEVALIRSDKTQRIDADMLKFVPNRGFFDQATSTVISSSEDDSITILPMVGVDVAATQIAITATVNRLSLTNIQGC